MEKKVIDICFDQKVILSFDLQGLYEANLSETLLPMFEYIENKLINENDFNKDFKLNFQNFNLYFFMKLMLYDNDILKEFEINKLESAEFWPKTKEQPKKITIQVNEIYERREFCPLVLKQTLSIKPKGYVFITPNSVKSLKSVGELNMKENVIISEGKRYYAIKGLVDWLESPKRTLKLPMFFPNDYIDLIKQNVSRIRVGDKNLELNLENDSKIENPFFTVLKQVSKGTFTRTLLHLRKINDWKVFNPDDLKKIRMGFLKKEATKTFNIDDIVYNNSIKNIPAHGIEMNLINIENISNCLLALNGPRTELEELLKQTNNKMEETDVALKIRLEKKIKDLQLDNEILTDFFERKQLVICDYKYYQMDGKCDTPPVAFLNSIYQTGYFFPSND